MSSPNIRSAEQLTEDALAIWIAGVKAVQGDQLIQNQLHLNGQRLEIPEHDFEIDLTAFRRICVLGAGKAGRAMTLGLEAVLAPIAAKKKLFGSVNIPQDSQPSTLETDPWANYFDLRSQLKFHPHPARWIELNQVRPPGLNQVTALAVKKTQEIVELAAGLTNDDLCIVLISGGGSALLASPVEGIDWQTKNQTIEFLSSHGAPIQHMNQVRSALSCVKAGGLLETCNAGYVLTLVISDVMGDPPATIASGPTHISKPRHQLSRDALKVLHDYDPERNHVACSVYEVLEQQIQNDSQKSVDNKDQRSNYFVLGNLAVAVDAAGIEAEKRGYSHVMHIQSVSQTQPPTAESEGEHFAGMLHSMQSRSGPDCLITGGEPVVDLSNATTESLGGRNLQLALASLHWWHQQTGLGTDPEFPNFCFVSGGTDGEDGPTPAAGALVSRVQIPADQLQGSNAGHYLHTKDAFHFFQRFGGLLLSAGTGTNVCDLRVGVVQRVQPQPGRKLG